ncbi:late embryogenesis abundant protein 18-like [Cynara cardunculus var. scolymus]|uniref:Late embryogenesis abundant protein, LEA-25/LEA-D113 n=1 Tax=Cynara cardunculus var. scolymus TaxID=59895 RepID=A0A103XJ48_CYNCS|nr:late embryogenesis abundant protein 18-like [Cynara cardunculus var. scolymus]KVH91725.1 Late embryogenesis abundant protein, LEA-25/LEA-D113 [Cynara cardunculus var. scolymus]
MHSVKEKVSNAASAAKAHVETYKANLEEKAEKATARTHEDKDIAHQRRKAKEAEANMNLHLEKADHAAEKLHGKHHVVGHDTVAGAYGGHHQTPVGTAGQTTTTTTTTGTIPGTAIPTTVPANPLGGHVHKHNKHI